jgi:hypothetical protein
MTKPGFITASIKIARNTMRQTFFGVMTNFMEAIYGEDVDFAFNALDKRRVILDATHKLWRLKWEVRKMRQALEEIRDQQTMASPRAGATLEMVDSRNSYLYKWKS